MKTLLSIILLYCTINAFAQEREFFNRTIAVDAIQMINLTSGVEPGYNEVEIIFTEKIQEKKIRFKLNINDKNVYENPLILSEILEDNAPVSLTYQVNEYRSNKNVKLSFGIAKIFSHESLQLYYGLDVNLGVNRGWVNTIIREYKVNSNSENIIATLKESIIFAGLTPVLGTNLSLGPRIFLGLEFGIEANYLFGDIHYLDTSSNYQAADLGRLDFNPFKFINDISVGINF